MTISGRTTLRELAFIVGTALDQAGITAVLTGGSAASIYAPDQIQSADLDFILVRGRGTRHDGARVLSALGFREVGGRYEHPDTPLWLEFPGGPLMIGRMVVSRWNSLRNGREVLHILTPSDSCCDRLAGYVHWNDLGSLEQAIAVAKANPGAVDLGHVRRWCEGEAVPGRFEEFRRRLESGSTRPRPGREGGV